MIRLLVENAARAMLLEVDVLDLDTALDELAAFNRRKARVAELRFFAGLSLEEIGLVLDTSLATTMRTGRRRAVVIQAFDPSKKRGGHQAPSSPEDVERVALHDVLEPNVAPAIHPPLPGGDQSACD
jgi:ECF sigma factor